MTETQRRVFSCMALAAKDGERISDVFDLRYKTNLEYPELKVALDYFIENGEVVCRGKRQYEYVGELEDIEEQEPCAKSEPILRKYKSFGDRYSASDAYGDDLLKRAGVRDEHSDDNFINIDDIIVDEDDEDVITPEDCAESAEQYLEIIGMECSADLQKVLSLAVTAAKKFGFCYVGTEHILFAMLLCDCTAKKALAFDEENMTEFFAAFKSIPTNRTAADGFTDETCGLISEAVQRAKEMGDDNSVAGTGHMLYKMLTNPRCAAADLVRCCGVLISSIIRRIAEIL